MVSGGNEKASLKAAIFLHVATHRAAPIVPSTGGGVGLGG